MDLDFLKCYFSGTLSSFSQISGKDIFPFTGPLLYITFPALDAADNNNNKNNGDPILYAYHVSEDC